MKIFVRWPMAICEKRPSLPIRKQRLRDGKTGVLYDQPVTVAYDDDETAPPG
jgi:hypothetical protein